MPTANFVQNLLLNVHCSWRGTISGALERLDPLFLDRLENYPNQWLPGVALCLAAFSVPRDDVRVVLVGESPYPRRQSANGLSFCDASVDDIFRPDGRLSRMSPSLMNILKAWFVAIGRLEENGTKQKHIKEMNKERLVPRVDELFQRGKENGWLWLNASLSFWCSSEAIRGPSTSMEICKWLPLIETVLTDAEGRGAKIVLLGELAGEYGYLFDAPLVGPHPAAPKRRAFVTDAHVRSFLREWRCRIER